MASPTKGAKASPTKKATATNDAQTAGASPDSSPSNRPFVQHARGAEYASADEPEQFQAFDLPDDFATMAAGALRAAEEGQAQQHFDPSDEREFLDSPAAQRSDQKQKTLVIASRGVSTRERFLVRDLLGLMPHARGRDKLAKTGSIDDLPPIAQSEGCNSVVFLEPVVGRVRASPSATAPVRDALGEATYLWLARVAPAGPTSRFRLLNVHTSAEIKQRDGANCARGSRPLLVFNDAFGDCAQGRLFRAQLRREVGVPRRHAKARVAPFHDHVVGFYMLASGDIAVRHWAVDATTPADHDDPARQRLTELGPRMLLRPERVLSGCFAGRALFQRADCRTSLERRLGAPAAANAEVDLADLVSSESECEA